MKINRLLRNKCGFSAIIAALILMLLAVAAGVVVYAYVMGWIGGATPSTTQTGRLQIDSIVASDANDNITIYVRNIGGVDVTLSSAYVNGAPVNASTNSTGNVFAVNSVTKVTLTSTSLAITAGIEYEAKLVCTDGTTISQSVRATT